MPNLGGAGGRGFNHLPEVAQAIEAVCADLAQDLTNAVYLETQVELDRLIYDTPESPNYQRTTNLYHSTARKMVTPTSGVVSSGDARAPYAQYVHEGTDNMPPRPYLNNAAKNVEAGMEQHLEKARSRIRRAAE